MPRLTAGLIASRRRRGLTLPEILIALVVMGIVGTALVRVFAKQQQVYRDLSLTALAKRELRLGAAVLPSELRSISTAGGDILSMSEQQVEMQAYIGTAVICDLPSTGTFYVPPTDLAHHVLTSFVVPPDNGDLVFVFDDGMDTGAHDDSWAASTIATHTTSTSHCPGDPFTDPVADAPGTKPRPAFTLTSSLPSTVQVGAVVRFARPVRYKIYQEASGNWYLGMQEFKGGSWGTNVPLAGPYRPFVSGDGNPSGLQFRFYDINGARITNMANTNDVTRIDVFLRTNLGPSAITERAGVALQDSVVMRVAIRNFQ